MSKLLLYLSEQFDILEITSICFLLKRVLRRSITELRQEVRDIDNLEMYKVEKWACTS